jgi:hypothetical protein
MAAAGRHVLVVLLIAGTLAVAGCGTKQVTVTGNNGQVTTQTVKNIHFANTKFVLHMGLAFGAFHRYIYKPLKNGALRSGAPHRLRTLAKAALAGAFIIHELHVARQDAESSNQLRPLLVKLHNFESRIASLVPGLKHGTSATTAIGAAAAAASKVGSASSGAGFQIKDITSAL